MIKIFSLPWHVAHQHELLKLNSENGFPFEWTYLVQHTRKWGEQFRPMPKHLKWVPYYEPGKYDLALLHVDQQCLIPELGKSIVFKEIRSQIKDIPIIVINHGTTVYPERFMQMAMLDGYKETEKDGEEWAKRKMKELLVGVSAMVVNSHQAKEMWGWGETIIHGLDPDEWFDLPKEPRSVTVLSPSGIGNKYYGRLLLEETRNILREKYGISHLWVGDDVGGIEFASSFDMYREMLGKSLVYFNPTFGSPMPRSRTEAMMSGCCIVTTKHHDVESFIKDGENGFIVNDNPEESAEVIASLIFDYRRAVKVGQEGKKTAIELFNGKRFRQDWVNLIEKVLNIKISEIVDFDLPDPKEFAEKTIKKIYK